MRKGLIIFFCVFLQIIVFSQNSDTKVTCNSLDSFVLGKSKSSYAYLKEFVNGSFIVGKDTIVSDLLYMYTLYKDYHLPYYVDTFKFEDFFFQFKGDSVMSKFFLTKSYNISKNSKALELADNDVIKLKNYFEKQIGTKSKFKKMLDYNSYIMYGYLWKTKANTVAITIQFNFKYSNLITVSLEFTTEKIDYY
jgi:hypothetical protein